MAASNLICDNKFPDDSPKMNLMTTGGNVRFNPNLYACGLDSCPISIETDFEKKPHLDVLLVPG